MNLNSVLSLSLSLICCLLLFITTSCPSLRLSNWKWLMMFWNVELVCKQSDLILHFHLLHLLLLLLLPLGLSARTDTPGVRSARVIVTVDCLLFLKKQKHSSSSSSLLFHYSSIILHYFWLFFWFLHFVQQTRKQM